MQKLILASASPRRKQLLERLGVAFTIEPSDYEEDMSLALEPKELAEVLATGKAEAVAVKHEDAVVIGADTFVEFDGDIIGKPYTEEKAIETLKVLSGKTHAVHTGYCVINTDTAEKRSGVETTLVTFRELTEEDIAAYVATKEPLLAAGAYMIQGGAKDFVSRYEGEYETIVGLPMRTIAQILAEFRIHSD